MKEKVLMIGEEPPLVGVLTEPEQLDRDLPTAVILNAGTLHRVGPNRLHVNLARALAQNGHRVLRFDFSGIGDSPPRGGEHTIEERVLAEVQEVLDALEAKYDAQRFVLSGLCSGAGSAFLAAQRDARVVGAVMLNPPWHAWDQPLRQKTLARHLIRIALFSSFRSKSWRKLSQLRFDVGMAMRSLGTGWLRRRATSTGQPVAEQLATQIEGVTGRGARVLVLHSEGDEGLDYYRLCMGARLRQLERSGRLDFATFPETNHTFALLEHQQRAIEEITGWIRATQSLHRG